MMSTKDGAIKRECVERHKMQASLRHDDEMLMALDHFRKRLKQGLRQPLGNSLFIVPPGLTEIPETMGMMLNHSLVSSSMVHSYHAILGHSPSHQVK
jgi:hypothetical protein